MTSAKETSAAKIAWRVMVALYDTDASFTTFRQTLARYPDIIDEIAFFETATHHLYFPLEYQAERAALLGRRVAALKADGVPSVGINVLCTIGHIDEAWDYLPAMPFQPLVGHDGNTSRSCACPNSPEHRAYIREKYRLMAQAAPDFIWVDDDIRLHHHGVARGCFCPTCLDIWAARTGLVMDRPALVEALRQPANGHLREQWVAQIQATLDMLLAEVRAAIIAVEPEMPIGLMTTGPGWGTYSGSQYPRWFDALGATKTRPGGGFYIDDRPLDMVGKALECGRQLVGLPATVADRQYEIESFPYCVLGKSRQSLLNECTLALGMGMNGLAMNALGDFAHGDMLQERLPLFEAVRGTRRYWDRLVQAGQGTQNVGLWPAWNTNIAARQQVREGEDWFANAGHINYGCTDQLAHIGLPLSPNNSGDGAVLIGGMVPTFTDEELRRLLAGGVLMDSAAVDALYARGLGELTGVRIARRLDNGLNERWTDDALNGSYAGWTRSGRIEFWGDARGQGDELALLSDDVHVLARLETFTGELLGPCVTAAENALGGRVAVLGYAPWMHLGSTAKRAQLQALADWLSRDRLPVRILEPVKLVPLVRLTADRTRGVVVLLNATSDVLNEATLHLRTAAPPSELLLADGTVQPLSAVAIPNGWQITLTALPGWQSCALHIGD